MRISADQFRSWKFAFSPSPGEIVADLDFDARFFILTTRLEAKVTKLKKPKKVRDKHRRRLRREEVNMSQEAEYIVERARDYEDRIVKIGGLVLFSTQTGDAWLLDPDDHFALCLARGGDRQFFHIIDSPTTFRIEWTANYHIDGEIFYVIEQSGQIQMFVGYPIAEILQMAGE